MVAVNETQTENNIYHEPWSSSRHSYTQRNQIWSLWLWRSYRPIGLHIPHLSNFYQNL